MRPSSLPVLLPLLLATFFAIVHAETNMSAAPSPSLDSATSPPPPPPPAWAWPWTPESPPPSSPPMWTPVSSPPPTPLAPLPVSPPLPPPTPPAWTPVSSPPSPPPASMSVSPPPPTWTPVANVNAPSIQQVGQFAVRIHALHQRVDIVYVKVVSGQTQPSMKGGYIYQLVIAVTGSAAKSPRYDAVVWGILGTTSWELLSFKPAK